MAKTSSSPKKPTRSSQRNKTTMSKPKYEEVTDVSHEEESTQVSRGEDSTQVSQEEESTQVSRGGKRKNNSASGASKSKRSRPELGSKTSPFKSKSEDVGVLGGNESGSKTTPSKLKVTRQAVNGNEDEKQDARLIGEPVPDEEARRRWPKRYQGEQKQVVSKNSKDENDSEIIQARRHYTQAEVDGRVLYNLYDDAHVKAEEGQDYYICKIVEMFEAVDGTLYFTAQWFYRARDTVMKKLGHLIDKKRVFFSEIRDDNPLDCLVEKLIIAKVSLNVDLEAKKKMIPCCDYYCDMLYLLPYSSFINLPPEDKTNCSEASSTISTDDVNSVNEEKSQYEEASQASNNKKSQVTLLDLYSGCGAMSTGLCLGANMAGLKLETRWAVDLNKYGCESLKWNHPETEVRNESAEDFLALLKEWERLCVLFSLLKSENLEKQSFNPFRTEDDGDDDDNEEDDTEGDVFEVEKILAICYGDPKKKGERGLHFQVRWKNYGLEEDTWEPLEGMGDCQECLKDFVTRGFNSKILPLPGDVDVICGGPPCQGISGFNRFRNKENPLQDEKNKQLKVFMEIVEYLKPKFVLMENVVDIVKFAEGFLGRYALSQLIHLNYQVRMGMMAAGAYGLPQFRMRVFLWGARPTEKLPQYPLPTHDVVVRGVIPLEFEMNTVAYDEGQKVELETKLLLEDAIADLPAVGNYEHQDEMDYDKDPQTEFQRFIRLRKEEMPGSSPKAKPAKHLLYDHRPLELNVDDYQRVCQIPKKKGANFRDLPGVLVRDDNKVEWDPSVERVYLKSGKPLVPDYAMSFIGGSSSKPFARLWWDETVPTVVTRAEPHNQAILHPEQDRVLSVRENARLQGFPDYYKLFGPVKERYIQVGNAVAVPVARALGYALGLAYQGVPSDEPLMKLPPKFPNIIERISSESSEDNS
ncbi:PREDICTED: DNA (cytosine-5)-methyltransferase CMT3 isoform X3 [Theobroma cacao]|uniref:Cytosine-specific methyltransferase n=1 Tax=Theobroma cacao TaxID=3641 RepID=A0AB32WRW8_THECC|nr:PREDICTED: DNA (cytosine-5)-methyltransferase CMT3 isoform X3 [Theobroma cacao]